VQLLSDGADAAFPGLLLFKPRLKQKLQLIQFLTAGLSLADV